MFLYINTTLENRLEVALYNEQGHKILDKTQAVKRDESEKLLKLIDEAVNNKTATWLDKLTRSTKRSTGTESGIKPFHGIIVVKGPKGRFSAIRTGVVCANALGFAWNIPVLGIEHGQNVKTALQKISKLKNFKEPIKPVYPPKFL